MIADWMSKNLVAGIRATADSGPDGVGLCLPPQPSIMIAQVVGCGQG